MICNPYREIAKRLFGRRIHQPVPDVTKEDIVRVIRRDFPEQFDAVVTVLNQYGIEKRERGQVRVHVAALKLANGSPEKLKRAIETAKRDYRDVIAAAEYPEYRRTWGVIELSRKEAERIVNADWAQYEEWLRK